MITETESQALERIVEILSRLNGVEIISRTDDDVDDKLYIFFTYKKGHSSVEEKAKFIDSLARILGRSDDYAAYSADIDMCWTGFKGIDGMNDPFYILRTSPFDVVSLADILNTDPEIRVAQSPALVTNNFPAHTRIARWIRVKANPMTGIFSNWLTAKPVFMSFIVALAKTARFFKERIPYLLIRYFSSHRYKSSEHKLECQSQQRRTF
jgi:hypothetical protein